MRHLLPGVLMLIENNPYAQDRRVQAEARTLCRAGYHVAVICPMSSNGKWFEELERVHVYQYPPLEGKGAVGYAAEYIYANVMIALLSFVVWRREGFEIIHANNPPDTFFVLAAFYRIFGKRFVFDHHDLAPEMYQARFGTRARPFVHRILLWLERQSCHAANQVLTTNESHRAIEMSRDGVPECRIAIVRNGPEKDVSHAALPIPELRARAKTIFCYVGRMAPQDGVEYLLYALDELNKLEKREWLCVLVGNGEAVPQLEALGLELGLARQLLFTGWVDAVQVPRYICTSDICVSPEPSNPYNERSTTIKAMEYMACGKPTVAFALREHRATLGDSALYAQPNDTRDFALKLAALMEDAKTRACLGAIGRERIEQELAWTHQEKKLLSAYARVLDVSPSQKKSEEDVMTRL